MNTLNVNAGLVGKVMDYKELALSRRKGTRRAIARFTYLHKFIFTEKEFETLVRRTQDAGYASGIKFIANYLKEKVFTPAEIKHFLFMFTIEYNMELHCKQFPKVNKDLVRFLNGDKKIEDKNAFKTTLYNIVMANKIQYDIIQKAL